MIVVLKKRLCSSGPSSEVFVESHGAAVPLLCCDLLSAQCPAVRFVEAPARRLEEA